MAAKLSKEAMLQFINENIAVYNGKADLSNIAEADEKTIEKTYRNIKTKLWSMSRKETAPAAGAIFALDLNKVSTLEQVAQARAELTEALGALDNVEAQIKATRKQAIEEQIASLQAQLDGLKEE